MLDMNPGRTDYPFADVLLARRADIVLPPVCRGGLAPRFGRVVRIGKPFSCTATSMRAPPAGHPHSDGDDEDEPRQPAPSSGALGEFEGRILARFFRVGALLVGAVRAAIDLSSRFDTVSDDDAAAMPAPRRPLC